MNRKLILVEAGFPQEALGSVLAEAAGGGDCYVLGESPLSHELSSLSSKVEVSWVDEFVSPSGAFHEDLLSHSKRLVDQWIRLIGESERTSAFEYEGISLLETARLSLIHQHVFPVVKQAAVLKQLLEAEAWGGITLLRAQGSLGRTLEEVLPSGPNALEIVHVEGGAGSPEQAGLARRALRRWAKGWGRQIELDLEDWLGRCASRTAKAHSSAALSESLYVAIVQGSLGAYLNTAIPVLQRLGREGRVLTFMAGDLAGAQELRRANTPVSRWSRFVPLTAWPRIARHSARLRRIGSTMRTDPEMEVLFQYEGIRLSGLLHERLNPLFEMTVPRILLWLEALKHLYLSRRPEAVLLFPDFSPAGIVASLLARRYEIPSLTVQAALSSDHAFLRPTYADVAAVVNRFSARAFENRGGVSAEQVVVTGLPRWDTLVNTDWRLRAEKAREQLGVSPEERLVCFATQWIPLSHTKRMLQAVLRGAASVTGARLVVKVHPAEPVGKYEDLLKQLPTDGLSPLVVSDIDFFALLSACDLLITSFSNVAMEAALLGRPVLITNLSGEPDPLPYVEDGLALGAYSEEEIERQVRALLCDSDIQERLKATQAQYRERDPELFDGQATERVIEQVKQLSKRP